MSFELLYNSLDAIDKKLQITIPGIWVGKSSAQISMGYRDFLKSQLSAISRAGNKTRIRQQIGWTNKAVIYNVFTRLFTAYDHDQDGRIGESPEDITLNVHGIRETGTFVKTIVLLPYLKQLGINTIHLLPITSIGEKCRKGDLGSPYAIKNPFRIDPLLVDPLIPLSVEEQYLAFTEAAHRMGMRVVQEFIFRTAAIDSEWSKSHPEWFYWLKESIDFKPPTFSSKELREILLIPKGIGRFIPPPPEYRNKFQLPPVGKTSVNLEIASAFADWPPNDLQPPWSDVTYLRMFNYDYSKENNYNYIAYNTIRHYDPELANEKHINHELWNEIAGIIPYYQERFHIDGAMIDMGHALPMELKRLIIGNARKINPYFAFWDENFSNTKQTKQEGYDAVIGDSWYLITKKGGFEKLIKNAGLKKPLPFFGTAETHNTPRFAFNKSAQKKAAWLLFNLLPQSIPFIHNGFEMIEPMPINTGLNFTRHQIKKYSSLPLPLFNKAVLSWKPDKNLLAFIDQLQYLKRAYPWAFGNKKARYIATDHPEAHGFRLIDRSGLLLAFFNVRNRGSVKFSVPGLDASEITDALTGKTYNLAEKNTLPSNGVLLFIEPILSVGRLPDA